MANIQPNFYFYPAVLTYADDAITVYFPDLPGCITQGENDEQAFSRATEALELHLWGIEKDGNDIPVATPGKKIPFEDNEIVILVRANMKITRQELNNKSVRKMVTIPKWLNDAAEDQHVNFSHILQEGLCDYLGAPNKRSS